MLAEIYPKRFSLKKQSLYSGLTLDKQVLKYFIYYLLLNAVLLTPSKKFSCDENYKVFSL